MLKNITRFFAKKGGYFDRFADIKPTRLEESELNNQLQTLKLDDWKYDKSGNRLSKRLSTKDYKNSNDFVTAVNGVAGRIGAKADISPGYDYLDINLNTQDLKGVSHRDLGLASSINRLEKSYRDYIKDGSEKKDYKLELNQQDEEDIFNSVTKSSGHNEGKGYGQSSGFADNVQTDQSGKGASYGQSYGQNQPNQQTAQSNAGQGMSYGQNGSCDTSDKDHKHSQECGPDGFNSNKNKKDIKNAGQDTLHTNPGQDADNKPQSSFGRYGSQDSTLNDHDISKRSGQGNKDAKDSTGQTAKSTNAYDKSGQDAYNKSDSSVGLNQEGTFNLKDTPKAFNVDKADRTNAGSANANPQTGKQKGYEDNTYPGTNQNKTNLQGDQSDEFTDKGKAAKAQGKEGSEGSQGYRSQANAAQGKGDSTARSDTIANKDYKSSQHESTPSDFTKNNKSGDTSQQNNQFRDSTAKFYNEQAKNSSSDGNQVNNTSYKANQDSAHQGGQASSQSNAQRAGQESKYGKGSETNQGVTNKDKVGTEYPNSSKGNQPKDSEVNRAQANRESHTSTDARQNQVQDETNKKRDNNDSNEFPNPRDRQDGVRSTTLKDEPSSQSNKDNKDGKAKQSENPKTPQQQKKDQEGFSGNQDKHKQQNEKSYK